MAGCSNIKTTPTVTLPPVPTRTRAPTTTEAPTVTAVPSATLTATPLPTATLTPTPVSELAKAKIYTIGFLPKWRFFFALEIPEKIQGSYYALVDKNKRYNCEIRTDKPNRLYCIGPQARIDDWVDYGVYEKDTDRLVYEGRIFVPLNIP